MAGVLHEIGHVVRAAQIEPLRREAERDVTFVVLLPLRIFFGPRAEPLERPARKLQRLAALQRCGRAPQPRMRVRRGEEPRGKKLQPVDIEGHLEHQHPAHGVLAEGQIILEHKRLAVGRRRVARHP